MNSAVVLAVLGVVTSAYAFPNVINFEMKEEEEFFKKIVGTEGKKLDKEILSLFKSPMQQADTKPVNLLSFSWMNCGSSASLATIKSLSVSPSPIVTPGQLIVSVQAVVSEDIGSPLKGNVTIEKKFGGSYIKLPCIGPFGSCEYPDMCVLLEQVQCPPPVAKTGLNCRCPIKKKTYTMTKQEFDINAAALPSGSFRVTGDFTYNSKQALCLVVELDIA